MRAQTINRPTANNPAKAEGKRNAHVVNCPVTAEIAYSQ